MEFIIITSNGSLKSAAIAQDNGENLVFTNLLTAMAHKRTIGGEIYPQWWGCEDKKDIIQFFEWIKEFGIVFHPDDDFTSSYEDMGIDSEDLHKLEEFLTQAHEVAEDTDLDIYELAIEVFYTEGKEADNA